MEQARRKGKKVNQSNIDPIKRKKNIQNHDIIGYSQKRKQ